MAICLHKMKYPKSGGQTESAPGLQRASGEADDKNKHKHKQMIPQRARRPQQTKRAGERVIQFGGILCII